MEAIVRGQQDQRVEHLQRLLARSGQHVVVDGVYGPRTQAAVATFLRAQGQAGSGASVDADLIALLEQLTKAASVVRLATTGEPAVPAIDDAGVQAEARAFARLICSRRTSAPLSIGLFGDWGSGKSFFMAKLQGEIEARCAAFTRVATALQPPVDGAELLALQQRWHGRVAQITFNAWHYAEPNLWASLVTRVFDELADIISPSESLEDTRARLLAEASQGKQRREQAKLELRRAEEQLTEARSERERREAELAKLREELAVVEAVAPPVGAEPGEASAQLSVRNPWAALRVTLRWIWSRGRWTRVAVIVAALLVVLGAVLAVAWWRGWWSRWLSPGVAMMTSGIGVLTGIASTVFAWWSLVQPRIMQARAAQAAYLGQRASAERLVDRALRELLQPNESALLLARRRLDEAKVGVDSATMATDQASEQMARARRMLQELEGGRRFYAFIRDRDEGDDYRRHLGLVSMVRDDFMRLEAILDQVEREGPGDGELAPLSRIVLYIDDLDRCDPARVVEVLQALNLLMAASIFVVVIAADVRWLRRSLALHYDQLLRTPDPPWFPQEDASSPTPRAYLERVIQIPFSLRPIDEDGFASIVDAAAQAALRPSAVTPAVSVTPAQQDADLAHDAALALDPAEVAFLQRLYAVVDMPRLRSLLASYRLLRVELDAEALASYLADGRYRGVLALMAIQLGRPCEASALLRALHRDPAPATTLGPLLLALGRESGSDLDEARWQALATAVQQAGVADTPVVELAPWAERVRRFSFDPGASSRPCESAPRGSS